MAPNPDSRGDNILEQIANAIRGRDVGRAAALAGPALAAGQRHPLLFTARAMSLDLQGHPAEALDAFRNAEALSPPNAALASAIGLCLIKLDRPAEAVTSFERAIVLQPASVQLHCRLGWAHELAGNPGPATRAFEQAIALDPACAEALGRLAYLAARQASWEKARNLADRALKLDSNQIAARLALATASIEEGAFEAAETALNMLLADPAVAAADRYLAQGLLGDLRGRQERIEEAFDAYAQANAAFQEHQTGQAHLTGRSAHPTPTMLETVSALSDHFAKTPTRLPAPVSAAADAPPHIFIVGFLRSGTTLLEQILASHPGIVTLEEKDTLQDAVRAFMERPEDFERLIAADRRTLEEYRTLYWQRVRQFGVEPREKGFVDKTPINTVKLPVISRLFPEAKILFAVRDPRDVVLSCFRRRFAANVTTREFRTLESTARFYDAVMRLAEIYRAKLAPTVHRIRLEDLIDDFDGEMRAVCSFSGLVWDDSMRAFAANSRTRSIATPSAMQVVREINRDGVGQWRRYERQMAPVLPLLRPWIEHFGYSAY